MDSDIMTGIVRRIVDCGSIVQVFIDSTEPVCCFDCLPDSVGSPWAADANCWYRGGAADAISVGDVVEFDSTDWGGLASIDVAADHPTCTRFATQRQ